MTEKMSSRPPIPKELDTLISAADKKPINMDAAPWLKLNVREDVTKTMNLPLSEPHMIKLKYLSEHLPNMSKQKFVKKAVEKAIDDAIDELMRK